MAAEAKSKDTEITEFAKPHEQEPSEDKTKDTQVAEIAVSQEQEPCNGVEDKSVDAKVAEENGELKKYEGDVSSSSPVVERIASFKEESNLLSDLKEHEKKALLELRSKIEEAIMGNKLFKEKKEPVDEPQKEKSSSEEGKDKKNSEVKEEKDEEKPAKENAEERENFMKEGEKNDKSEVEGGTNEKTHHVIDEMPADIDKDISLWGVPLLPSKGDKGTDVILLKFLRAREFNVKEAFEMLRNTLQWRKEYKIESILDENFCTDIASVVYMSGMDREGHPICYNIYGVFANVEVYNMTFGTEEKREKFLRWRFQLMEKGIQSLNFKPGGVSSLLQINDLKNAPGPSKRELRLAMKRAIGLLQDNYPEFVARNIFINVPFWYYAFNALLSPFLTQRTKSKFFFARPARVTETLLKYIAAEEIPVLYGGLKRENDSDFSSDDGVEEVTVKAGSTEAIEIPAPEIGTTLIWDLTVLGWEVNYTEEFVPTDEGSYTVIVSKGRKIGWQEGSVRNSFKNNEPGKVLLKVENGSFKKKRVIYRYKTKNNTSSSSSC